MSIWDSLVVSLWCGKFDNDFDNKDIKCFRTFGNHDIITITPIEGETGNDILQDMWKKTNEYSTNLKAGESIHNLFAVSDDCGNFWKSDFPFLFVSAIQINFDNVESFEKQFKEFKDDLEYMLEKDGFLRNQTYAVYNALDCGDILLFLRSKTYALGANAIHNITINSKRKHYGYSVCGIDTNLILNDEKYDEVIPKVVICSVFNEATQYNNWFSEFTNEYPNEFFCCRTSNYISNGEHICDDTKNQFDEYVIHSSRLGNEDVCINIYNCKLKHFVEMMTSEKGVFSYKNKLFRDTFTRSRIQFDSNMGNIKSVNQRQNYKPQSLIEKNAKDWKPILKKLSSPYVYKAITEVFAASENLEYKAFAFDVQDCIRNVFPLFLQKTKSLHSLIENPPYEDYDKDLILFTTGLMSIANGSLHADKLFINVPGFNAVTCDVPSKLLSYYTAYIQNLVSVLNDTPSFDYRFLICPDLYIGIEVVRLFDYKEDDSHLLKARVPVKKLFDPQTLFMELSHEVAHFVGNKIRQREKRVNTLVTIVAYTIADRILRPKTLKPIQFPSVGVSADQEKVVITSFFPKNRNTISIDDLLGNEWNAIPEFIKNKLLNGFALNDEKELYLSNVKEKLYNTAFKVLTDDYNKTIQNKVLEVLTTVSPVFNDIDSPFFLSKILDRHVSDLVSNELFNIIRYTCSLCYESFADMVMLYITQDIQAYLMNIYEFERKLARKKNGKVVYPWKYNEIGNMKIERIISVIDSLGYDLKEEIDKIKTNDNVLKSFLDEIVSYRDKEKEDSRASSFITISENTQYLKFCVAELQTLDGNLESLRDLYKIATKADKLDDCIGAFRNCAFEFRTKLINANKLNIIDDKSE